MDSGVATMVAAFIAAVVSIIGVIISSLLWYLTRSQISRAEQELAIYQARMENWKQISTEVRDHNYRQLSDFYDPIYALLTTNRKIFQTVGPGAAPNLDTHYPPEENANAWEQFKENVIIPNNQRICEIVTTKLHLLHKEDVVDLYVQFIMHARAYEVFTKSPYEGYTNFRFPSGFLENVEAHRVKVKSELDALLRGRQK